MNPFTKSLIAQVKDQALVEFVARWDALESLAVRVYRAGAAGPADEAEHRHIRAWLLARYPDLRDALGAYWPRTRIGREPTAQDPFASLLSFESAHEFAGNRPALQTLPAAREALNLLLVDAQAKP